MRSRPEASSTAVSAWPCSTTGEKACAHSTSRAGSAGACMQAYMQHLSIGFGTAGARFQTLQEFAAPLWAGTTHFQDQRGAGFCQRLLGNDDNGGRGVFNGAAQAEPGRERNAAREAERGVAEVEHHQAEAAGLDNKVGGFERAFCVRGAADPEEAVEVDAGGRGSERIKRAG